MHGVDRICMAALLGGDRTTTEPMNGELMGSLKAGRELIGEGKKKQ